MPFSLTPILAQNRHQKSSVLGLTKITEIIKDVVEAAKLTCIALIYVSGRHASNLSNETSSKKYKRFGFKINFEEILFLALIALGILYVTLNICGILPAVPTSPL